MTTLDNMKEHDERILWTTTAAKCCIATILTHVSHYSICGLTALTKTQTSPRILRVQAMETR